MKISKKIQGYIFLALRILCGSFFSYFGFSKLVRSSDYFQVVIYLYEIPFIEPLVPMMARVIPWIEFIFGSYLVIGFLMKITVPTLTGISIILELILAQAILRRLNIEASGILGGIFIPLTLYQAFILVTFITLMMVFLIDEKHLRFSLDQWFVKLHQRNKKNDK